MPCDIGYRTYAPVRIPQPKPQVFKKRMPAPSVDQDLLEKLGVDDRQFLEWINELNIKPLLEEALKRALAVQLPRNVSFSITEDGNVLAEGAYLDGRGKDIIEKATDRMLNRWQMEVLKIVTQLLGYDANIQSRLTGNSETLVLVAEEKGKSHPCKYVRISKDPNGNGEIAFEHFASKPGLEKEKIKFAALAQKLGIKIVLPDSPVNGQPISVSIQEQHAHSHQHRING